MGKAPHVRLPVDAFKDLEKEVDDQKWLWLESNEGPDEVEVKRLRKDLEKQDGDQKMVDKTNSGLESKDGENEGAPPTQKRDHRDSPIEIIDDEENIGKVIDTILDILIATLERLRIGIKSSSVLYIYCKDLWEYLDILSSPRYYAIYALNSDKLENWLTFLEELVNMSASDEQLTDSEIEIDFNDALKKLSINNVLEVTK